MKYLVLIITMLCLAGTSLHAQAGVRLLNNRQALETALNNNEKVVVIFAAAWCDYCKEFLPKVERIAPAYRKIKFFKIYRDANIHLFEAENIEVVPTTKLYRNGKELDKMVVVEVGPLLQKLNAF